MRFRKSIKIAPGVKLNVSKSGISTTVGQRGLSTSLNKNGAYLNMGLPGTGLSQRTKIDGGGAEHQTPNHEPETIEQTENTKINLSEIKDIPTLKNTRKWLFIVAGILTFLGIISIATVILPILFFGGVACVLFTAHTVKKQIKKLQPTA